MIKIDFELPDMRDLVRDAMSEIENDITKKAQRAAAPHGGVTVKVERKPDGTIRTINLQGSEEAVEAVKTAIAD